MKSISLIETIAECDPEWPCPSDKTEFKKKLGFNSYFLENSKNFLIFTALIKLVKVSRFF